MPFLEQPSPEQPSPDQTLDDQPFQVDVPQAVLDDLRERLARTRLPDDAGDDWERGVRPGALRTLLDHWRDAYDWRAQEARVNRLDNRRAAVRTDDLSLALHWVRAGTPGATPPVLLHGWPDSFLRFEDLLPLLEDRFELVVPSIPGYGFSERPGPGVGPQQGADLVAALMSGLGLDRFLVHGGDLGSMLGEQLALRHPDRLLGLHLTDVPWRHAHQLDQDALGGAERDWVQRGRTWSREEGAYGQEHSTKPQTLASALNDSPAGLAAWMLEKFHSWSDLGDHRGGGSGDVFAVHDLDRICTNLTLYWVTETAGSAVRWYYESAQQRVLSDQAEQVPVPTGFALFPADLVPGAPRELAERFFDVRRFSELPRGGHFAAWEEPALLAEEIRGFADDLGL